jgi:hypothetical protein
LPKLADKQIGHPLATLLRVDDDDEMNELASSALPSYPELVALIADLSERVASREQALKVKVWEWSNATDEERQGWLDELHQWMHKTLCLFAGPSAVIRSWYQSAGASTLSP